MTTVHDSHVEGDEYVLVPKRRIKISRARKVLIGVMAVSTVAAVAGAGTFASFSASTTNDASFTTATLALSNTKAGGTGTCTSNVGLANLDTNDKACDAAVTPTALVWGTTYTADLTLANATSGSTAALKLFADAACSSADTGSPAGTATSTQVCTAVSMQVQEYTTSGFSTASSKCAYPFNASVACATFDTGTNFPIYSSALSLGNLVNGTSRFFRVQIKTTNGGYSAAGIGLDNKFMNKTATLKMRWSIEA